MMFNFRKDAEIEDPRRPQGRSREDALITEKAAV